MSDNPIQFTIDNLQENLEVEAKNWLNGLSGNENKAKLAKEIIALANHGGGYVFVGFDDANNCSEIMPQPNEFEAFTQYAVSQIVQRYVTPPCQCRVEFYTLSDGQQRHPVIIVPGGHRTPVFAKKGSPCNTDLKVATLYVRRPGGYSEPATTQDDWEKLLERLVKARQADLLAQIREIIDPSSHVLPDQGLTIEDWDTESYEQWRTVISEFMEDDPRRFKKGHWTASFIIDPFDNPSLSDLNAVLDCEVPRYSGWPPFTYLHRDPVRPQAKGNVIQTYIGHLREGEQPIERAEHADFWRVSREGKGFLLRSMQEDRPGFMNNIHPKPEGSYFDWVIPIWRVTELLKYIEVLGERFGDERARFQLLLRYYGTSGRKLQINDFKYMLDTGATCSIDILENRIEAGLPEINFSIEELVFSILRPIFEQFEFSVLPKALVNNVVKDVLNYRR